jgi:hypothetical protein
MLFESVFCLANSITNLVMAMPLDGPKYLGSSFAANLMRPAPRTINSASAAWLTSFSAASISLSSVRALSRSWTM